MISNTHAQATDWHTRPLCCRYLLVQFETLPLQVQEAGVMRDQAAHWAFGVLADGQSEVIGVWLAPLSGPMCWQEVFEDLEVRGVEKVRFVAGTEAAAVGAAYPRATVLPSTGQLLRQSLEQVAARDRGAAADALGAIRGTGTAGAARTALTRLAGSSLGARYVATVDHWRDALVRLAPFYALAPGLRRIVVAGDDTAQQLQLRLSLAVDRHGSFGSRADAVSFLTEALVRAEDRLIVRRASLDARTAPHLGYVTDSSRTEARGL